MADGIVARKRRIDPAAPPLAAGQHIGRWTLVGTLVRIVDDESIKKQLLMWLCRCDCGRVGLVRAMTLKNGASKSCGCLVKDSARERFTTHGGTNDPVYKIWAAMKDRCANPRNKFYRNYGGRGITVTEEWQDFERFRDDVGPRPPNTSIDRIDVNRGYEKSNVRWAASEVQHNNKRNTRLLTYGGRTMSISQWAREVNMDFKTIDRRLADGWTVEMTLTTPPIPEPNRLLSHDGFALTIRAWSTKTGLDYGTLVARLRTGWSIERALTTPSRVEKKHLD